MKRSLLNIISIVLLCGICINTAIGQVAINTTGASPDNSAMLDVQSTSKGMLIPRMTTSQIAAMQNPANGLIVFDTKKGLTVYTTGRGWGRLESIPSGRLFVSETYPDTLYTAADYDYLGVFYQQNAFKKNYGTLPGGWLTKNNNLVDFSLQRQYCYTGSVSNKVLMIGASYNSVCDSCILVYNISNDSLYKETIGSIKRFDRFTATTDTTNSRIFIWGGFYTLDADDSPERTGFIYNYNTGSKVLMDSITAPSPRYAHSAIWASSVNKLLIFGGYSFKYIGPSTGIVNTLYAYNPASNNWSALATSPLSPRMEQITLYNGNDHMLVWGGNNGNGTEYFDGAVYTISTNSWAMMASTGAPSRKVRNGSWTGTDMLLTSPNVNQGAYDYLAYRYNLATNTWTSIPAIPGYLGKISVVIGDHFWNGNSMLQMAYLFPSTSSPTNVMWSYDPISNAWTALAGAPLNFQEPSNGVPAGDAIIFNNYFAQKFFRYLPLVPGSPSYQVEDQQFHYYKKR